MGTTTGKTTRKKAKTRNVGAEIIEGLEEAIAFEAGEDTGASFKAASISARHAAATPAPEFTARQIVSIRQSLGFSQTIFAQALNVSPETEKAWEQGKTPPSGSSKRLLEIAMKHPQVIREVLVSTKEPQKAANPSPRAATMENQRRRTVSSRGRR